jgi:hypothetical protein
VVAGLLKRADEIGFEESLDLILFLLVLSRQLFVRDWILPIILTVEVDVVDEDGSTGRARMCCRSKPTGEQRQATRGAGRLQGMLVGPDPSVNGPGSGTRPGV